MVLTFPSALKARQSCLPAHLFAFNSSSVCSGALGTVLAVEVAPHCSFLSNEFSFSFFLTDGFFLFADLPAFKRLSVLGVLCFVRR